MTQITKQQLEELTLAQLIHLNELMTRLTKEAASSPNCFYVDDDGDYFEGALEVAARLLSLLRKYDTADPNTRMIEFESWLDPANYGKWLEQPPQYKCLGEYQGYAEMCEELNKLLPEEPEGYDGPEDPSPENTTREYSSYVYKLMSSLSTCVGKVLADDIDEAINKLAPEGTDLNRASDYYVFLNVGGQPMVVLKEGWEGDLEENPAGGFLEKDFSTATIKFE